MSKTWEHYHVDVHHERPAHRYREAAKYDEAEEHEKDAHNSYLGHNQHHGTMAAKLQDEHCDSLTTPASEQGATVKSAA